MKAADAIIHLRAGHTPAIRRRCWHPTRWLQLGDDHLGAVYLITPSHAPITFHAHSIDAAADDWVAETPRAVV